MDHAMEVLGYATLGALLVMGAAAATVLVRELPGIARYVRISSR